MTYSFFIRYNHLHIRIVNNRRKSDLSLRIPCDADELETALLNPKARKKTRIGNMVRAVCIMLDTIHNRMVVENREAAPASEICTWLQEELGFKSKTERGEFARWFFAFIDTKKGGTKRVYEHTWSRVKAYIEQRTGNSVANLTFKNVNLGWLERFEAYLAETASKNARNIHLRNIRAVFNYALDHEMDIPYPFRRFKIRPEETRKRALHVEDLRELIAMETEDYAELYRDMFVLSFMLIGINMADLYNIERIENGRIEYRRAKTHRLYSIKVEPEAMAIIERWRGRDALLCIADRWTDHRNFVHQCNLALKKLGMTYTGKRGAREGEPRWPDLSTYWARHTWSTIAYNKCKIPKDVISQALGHASGSKTTEIYLDKDQSLVDEANRRVLDYVLYNKL